VNCLGGSSLFGLFGGLGLDDDDDREEIGTVKLVALV